MGACLSEPEHPPIQLPAPTPADVEDWARLGVPASLLAHAFVSRVLDEQEEDAAVRRARGAAARGKAAAKDRRRYAAVRVRFVLASGDGAPVGEVVESAATLEPVREELLRAPRARNPLSQLEFLRVAQFLTINRAVVAAGLADGSLQAFTTSVAPRDVHLLAPEPPRRTAVALLELACDVAGAGRGSITEDALERWMSPARDSIGDSVFFHCFFRTVRRGPEPRSVEAELSVAEFAQAVDRFCSFSEAQLLTFAFFCLARVGLREDEVPMIAVSSLSRIHPELREAERERGHNSRPFLDEVFKRQRALAAAAARARKGGGSGADERLHLLKTAAYATSLERSDFANGDLDAGAEADEGSGADDEESWGARGGSQGRRKAPTEPLCSGPDDLLTLHEFHEMALLSPMSVFELVWMRDHLRRAVGGERAWARRERATQVVARGTGEGTFYGYAVERLQETTTPAWQLDELGPSMRVRPAVVPAAVRFALTAERGVQRTPGEGLPAHLTVPALKPPEPKAASGDIDVGTERRGSTASRRNSAIAKPAAVSAPRTTEAPLRASEVAAPAPSASRRASMVESASAPASRRASKADSAAAPPSRRAIDVNDSSASASRRAIKAEQASSELDATLQANGEVSDGGTASEAPSRRPSTELPGAPIPREERKKKKKKAREERRRSSAADILRARETQAAAHWAEAHKG